MANDKTKKKAKDEQQPNLVFIGKGKDQKTDLSQALHVINNGMEKIELPDDQSKPFFHKRAGAIAQLYPKLYKVVREK
jgi:hypothetical protein